MEAQLHGWEMSLYLINQFRISFVWKCAKRCYVKEIILLAVEAKKRSLFFFFTPGHHDTTSNKTYTGSCSTPKPQRTNSHVENSVAISLHSAVFA
jgi:hypothetical protein